METKTYTTIDRTGWVSGRWDGEPDKVQWPDEATGLPCLAVRHRESGHWCGYVGVPPGHAHHGKDYNSIDADVHGGLTFDGACQPGDDESHGVCHTPAPGEPEHVWWLGFDCHHCGDVSPRDLSDESRRSIYDWNATYKALGYVKTECAKLAAQLAESAGTLIAP